MLCRELTPVPDMTRLWRADRLKGLGTMVTLAEDLKKPA